MVNGHGDSSDNWFFVSSKRPSRIKSSTRFWLPLLITFARIVFAVTISGEVGLAVKKPFLTDGFDGEIGCFNGGATMPVEGKRLSAPGMVFWFGVEAWLIGIAVTLVGG